MADPSAPFSRAVQALRAVSAIMVMTHHILAEARLNFDFAYYPSDAPLEWSVDLFFVISGAVIVISTHGYFGQPGASWRYLRARLIRVIPAYWVATTCMAALLVAFALRYPVFELDLPKIAASYAFWPYEGLRAQAFPILPLGWTLNMEMFFYLSFWVVLMLCRSMGQAVLVLSVGFIGLALLGQLSSGVAMPFRFWTDKDILNFVSGAVLGYIWIRSAWRLRYGWWIAILAFALMLPVAMQLRVHEELAEWIAMVFAAVIVGAALLGLRAEDDARVPDFAVALGDSSYSLYLSHIFVIMFVSYGIRRVGLDDAVWLYILLCWGPSIVLGHLLWIRAERPSLRRLRRLVPGPRPAPAA